jgi:hypothetical protein
MMKEDTIRVPEYTFTKWLLRCIRDKAGLAKETEIEEAPLKYTKFDRVRVVEIIDGFCCHSYKYCQQVGLPCRCLHGHNIHLCGDENSLNLDNPCVFLEDTTQSKTNVCG